MLEVMFCCTCDDSGTIYVSRRDWQTKTVRHTCSRCGAGLSQEEHHFELLDRTLQRERIRIIYKEGPLSRCDRTRLREIHKALGNAPTDRMPRQTMDLVLKRGSVVMGKVRDEMLAEAIEEAEAEGSRVLWVENPDNLPKAQAPAARPGLRLVTPEGFEPSSPV